MKALFEDISDFKCLDKLLRSESGGTTAQIARKLDNARAKWSASLKN
jgi:predicted transcriptional regulator